MNDDYLWDGSGDPDPEVQHLERVLGKYRYQAKPPGKRLTSYFTWRRSSWVKFAAAAAAVLIILGAMFVFKPANSGVTQQLEANQGRTEQQPAADVKEPDRQPGNIASGLPSPAVDKLPAGRNRVQRIHHKPSKEEPALAIADPSFVAQRQPIIIPFVDVETARHLERAQLLLRSFRNSRDSGTPRESDLSYERQRSKGLLSKNILLRRDAEAKGNMPVDELLGSLEPFLLDIANLPDKPAGEEVRSIKERMQRKEILATLQVYSSPTVSHLF